MTGWYVSSFSGNVALLTHNQAANKHNSSLQTTTKSVHEETVRIVDEQVKGMELQMQALDDFVSRAQCQNARHHENHTQSLQTLSSTVKTSYDDIGAHFTSTYERIRDLGDEMSENTTSLQETLVPLDSILRQPLAGLRSNITTTRFQEYQPTGETPQKVQYQYPTKLPRTEPHEQLLAALNHPQNCSNVESPSKPTTIPVIFHDAEDSVSDDGTTPFSFSASMPAFPSEGRPATSGGLREIDVNINAVSLNHELQGTAHSASVGTGIAKEPREIFKKSVTAGGKLPVLRSGKKSSNTVLPAEGRENVNVLAQSTGRRRSPRIAG